MAPTVLSILPWVVALLAGMAGGFVLGSRRARRRRQQLQRQLNESSLDLLDARADYRELSRVSARLARRERLLTLTLKRLSEANRRVSVLRVSQQRQEKRHEEQLAETRLRASRLLEHARRATAIAERASRQLRILEANLPASQTIKAPPPKSYGLREPVMVSVVDQPSPDAAFDTISRVSHRDSARLARLLPSNDGARATTHPQDLATRYERLLPAMRRELRRAGVFNAAQLERLTDQELHALARSAGIEQRVPRAVWALQTSEALGQANR